MTVPAITFRVLPTYPADATATLRTRLTAAGNVYVRKDGSDLNDGSADDAAHAFLTISAAVRYVARQYDLNHQNLTIWVNGMGSAATYTENVVLPDWVGYLGNGFDQFTIEGTNGTVTVTGTTAQAAFLAAIAENPIRLKNLTIGNANNSSLGVEADDGGLIVLDTITFGTFGTAAAAVAAVVHGARVLVKAGTITFGASVATGFLASGGTIVFQPGVTIALGSGRVFSSSLVNVSKSGQFQNTGMLTTGSLGSSSVPYIIDYSSNGRIDDVSLLAGISGAGAATATAITTGQGGTGAKTFTTNGVLYGNGTGAVQVTAAGGAGTKVLTSVDGAAPTWASGGGGSGDVVGPASSVASEVVLFDGTTGKLVKRATGSGIATLTSGVLSATATTGTGIVALQTSPSFVTPALGTPSSGTLTNCTGLPIGSGVSGLAANVATFLGTPSSANLAAALTDETGTGANVFATSPTLVTPILGTPTSGTLTNCTGLPIATGVSGLAANVATFLATPSSANLLAAVTDETGTGSLVFSTSPTFVTPTLGVASATSLTTTGSITSGTTITASGDIVSTKASGTLSLTLTGTANDVQVSFTGAGGVSYFFKDTNAGTDVKFLHQQINNGISRWRALSDVGAVTNTFMTFNHVDGRVEIGSPVRSTGFARNNSAFAVTSSTTLANVTGISVSLVAGKTYMFKASLYTTSNSAGGVKFAMGGTASATAVIYEAVVNSGATINAIGTSRATSLATAVGDITAVTVATCQINGSITVNTAGTLTIQFAQNASNGSASTVLANSWLEVFEVA